MIDIIIKIKWAGIFPDHDIYPCDEIKGDHSFEFLIILEGAKGGEYVKCNGEPYLFDPLRKVFFRVVVYHFFSILQKDGLK